MKLAEEIGGEEFVQEARVNQGFIRALKALYELKGLVKGGKVAEANKPEAKRYFQMYVDSLRLAIDAMPKWERTIMRGKEVVGRTNEGIRVCNELIKNMSAVAGELGIQVQ